MKTFVLVALLGLASVDNQVNAIARFRPQGVTFVQSHDSDSSDDENVMVGDDYPAYMHGFGGYHTYMRDIPDRFETESDDRLMHSMYNQYATEGQKDGLPDGNFWLTKADAKRASMEVVGTHLHLKGKDAETYVNGIFPALWDRYDVNEDGKIEIDRSPVFLRQVCGSAEACVALQ